MLAWRRQIGLVFLAGTLLLVSPAAVESQFKLVEGVDCSTVPISIEGVGAAANCTVDEVIGDAAFAGNQHYKRMSPPDPRISEADARGIVYWLFPKTPDDNFLVRLNEATFRSHVPFVNDVAAWASSRQWICRDGRDVPWSPTRSMEVADATWFYATVACPGQTCIVALTYWGVQQNGYKYGVNAFKCVAETDYDEATARDFLVSIKIHRGRLD